MNCCGTCHNPGMRKDLTIAIAEQQSAFDIELTIQTIERFADYYDLIGEHNPILHLVGPCSAEEFATRHILESLTLLKHLPLNVKIADIGSGAGLPAIPCLIARDDLHAVLVEAKEKKARFLEQAVERLGLTGRVTVVARQFHEIEPGDVDIVTCRALDKFTEKLPRLLKWSGQRKLLLFGGNNLAGELKRLNVTFRHELMPLSEQRYLFTVDR